MGEESGREPGGRDRDEGGAVECAFNHAGVAGGQENHGREKSDEAEGEPDPSVLFRVELLAGVVEGDIEIGAEQESEEHDGEHPEWGEGFGCGVDQRGIGFLDIRRAEGGDQYAKTQGEQCDCELWHSIAPPRSVREKNKCGDDATYGGEVGIGNLEGESDKV